MAIRKMNLRNLIQLFYAPERLRLKLLRDSVSADIRKSSGHNSGGQSFYGPFWADAKSHAAGFSDLSNQTKIRVQSNKNRSRLYPELSKGFLNWWDEKRRWRNEPFEINSITIPAQATLNEIGCVVKIENMFSAIIDHETKRLIYPYFSEIPALSEEAVRVGIALINEATPQFYLQDIRILDVLRGTAYGTIDYPLLGNERSLFISHYERALADWDKIMNDRI